VLFEVFLDGFLGFADGDSDKNETLVASALPILSTKAASFAQ